MGLKPKETKNHKQKSKRKRGKKFVFQSSLQATDKQEKSNPFESFSNQKFFKSKSNNYSKLVTDYQKRNSTNTIIDKRIGEYSNLSQDEKMKLRFKAQQLLKTNKRQKFQLNEDDDNINTDEITLTHKGKTITEDNIENIEPENDEEFYDQMHNYLDTIESRAHMTKAERTKAFIEQSKKFKMEKQKEKEDNVNRIVELDENFAELSSFLRKRQRTFSKFNDDYDKYAANFIYADKIYPTERVKTQEEIEMENEMKIKKQNMKRLKEEALEDEENDNGRNNNKGREEIGADDLGGNAKQMTKKERIEKLIQERLQKSQKIKDSLKKNKTKEKDKEDEDEDEEDNDFDLDEFEKNDNEEEEEEGEEEEEEEEKEGEEEEEEEGEEEEDEDYCEEQEREHNEVDNADENEEKEEGEEEEDEDNCEEQEREHNEVDNADENEEKEENEDDDIQMLKTLNKLKNKKK